MFLLSPSLLLHCANYLHQPTLLPLAPACLPLANYLNRTPIITPSPTSSININHNKLIPADPTPMRRVMPADPVLRRCILPMQHDDRDTRLSSAGGGMFPSLFDCLVRIYGPQRLLHVHVAYLFVSILFTYFLLLWASFHCPSSRLYFRPRLCIDWIYSYSRRKRNRGVCCNSHGIRHIYIWNPDRLDEMG